MAVSVVQRLACYAEKVVLRCRAQHARFAFDYKIQADTSLSGLLFQRLLHRFGKGLQEQLGVAQIAHRGMGL